MGILNNETGAIELNSRNGRQFRMYGDSSNSCSCYYISGLHGPYLFVYADCIQDAFDVVADDSTEFDGMYVDEQISEAVSAMQDEAGIKDEDIFYADEEVMSDIYRRAEENTFTVGNYSMHLSSGEWHAAKVGRNEIFSIRGYSDRGMQ